MAFRKLVSRSIIEAARQPSDFLADAARLVPARRIEQTHKPAGGFLKEFPKGIFYRQQPVGGYLGLAYLSCALMLLRRQNVGDVSLWPLRRRRSSTSNEIGPRAVAR
jgi:hypothetical protein